MQLKRDTDFALRVLFCLNENAPAPLEEGLEPMTLSAIAAQSGVPKSAAGRICKCLAESDFICANDTEEGEEVSYSLTAELSAWSLLNVIEAVEGTGKIFAVFDRKSLMYKNCDDQISLAQGRIEHLLASISLDDLIDEQGAE